MTTRSGGRMSRRDEDDRWDRYRGDVFYEAWRRGIDPDRAADCARDCFYDGRSAEECVNGTANEIRREQKRREEQRYQEIEMERRAYEEQQFAEWEQSQEQDAARDA